MSVETTLVATSSLQAISLEHGQGYSIMPNITHGNIRMGMIAIVVPHPNTTSLPMDITFEIGDPEKDGSVGIREV